MIRRQMAFIKSGLLIFVSAWIGLSVLFYLTQSSYIYYPTKEITVTPADIQLEFEEIYIETSDKQRLHGWFIPHPTPRATLLFFHGNGGNISHRLEKINVFNDLGLNIFIFDYRGYGLSTGDPDEAGTYADAIAAYRFLIEEKNISPENTIFYGESLGSSISSWLAKQHPPGALILDSGFTSIKDMASHYYPFLPVNIITRIRYPTLQHMMDINSPLLVIHSIEDEIIPFDHGLELYEKANGPKTMLQISGDHNFGFYTSLLKYKEGMNSFISQWL